MATINLGNIKFKWQGAYNGATSYTLDDVVSYNGSSYICIQASTGNLPTDTAYWEQMAQAGTNGTNGTDVGTVITTQGDLLYRDGSGLQRLGAGTANQVLLSGGAGANPSWGTLSSDFVKLGQHDFAVTNANGVTFDNVFDNSTYASYVVIGSGLNSLPSNTTNCNAYFRTGGASGTDLNSGYAYVKIGAYREWNAVWQPTTATYTQSQSNMEVHSWGGGHTSYAGGVGSCSFEATIKGTRAGVMSTLHSWTEGGLFGNVPYLANENLNWINQSTTEITGIRLFQGSSTIYTAGTITVYGLK